MVCIVHDTYHVQCSMFNVRNGGDGCRVTGYGYHSFSSIQTQSNATSYGTWKQERRKRNQDAAALVAKRSEHG
ncbi:hypothetical protein BPOR_1090g00030 [Botrytis porri]|uniref:Uncharacterized protein n=1 Tax=Botrytis porri TaxID=87229 RepID=A0A4Z1K6M2_9HELO|nr:hypothetical protein BPOR_1090g00030 [Botrytis porri]